MMKITLLSNIETAPFGSFYDDEARADITSSMKRSGIDFQIANVNTLSELEFILANNSDLFWPNIYTFNDKNGIQHWPVELLEKYELPFVGPNKEGLIKVIDKSICQSVLNNYDVPIPKFATFNNESFDENILSGLNYPLIVKPVADCGSQGIFADSIAYTIDDVKRNTQRIRKLLNQGSIVEEFLSGTELTVGVVSNNSDFFVVGGSYDLEKVGISIRDRYSKENKLSADSFTLIKDEQINARLNELAKKVYAVSEAKEFTRFDCRFDGQGNIKVFDVNGMPGLGMHSSTFPKYFFLANPNKPELEIYDALVNTIIRGAAIRYNLPIPAVIQEKNLFNPVYKKC